MMRKKLVPITTTTSVWADPKKGGPSEVITEHYEDMEVTVSNQDNVTYNYSTTVKVAPSRNYHSVHMSVTVTANNVPPNWMEEAQNRVHQIADDVLETKLIPDAHATLDHIIGD